MAHLGHVAGWELYNNLHDVAHLFLGWICPIIHRTCTPYRNGTLGSIDDLDHNLDLDLSDLSDVC